MLNRIFHSGLSGLLLLLLLQPLSAAEALVAVAANFTTPARQLVERFQRDSEHRIRLGFGSTGKLYAQIRNGAPYDAFLAADAARPQRLAKEGLAVAGSRFTYAIGSLVLWSPVAQRFDDGAAWLRSGSWRRLAMASPDTAPYGRAAQQTLECLGLWSQRQQRMVRGESIAQALQFVATGNADAGFVALAQVRQWLRRRPEAAGSLWPVPADCHEPVVQQAVLLKRGADNPAAQAFLDFLRQPETRQFIEAAGYRLDTPGG